MTKQLTNLEIDEISLVDDPANPHAKVAIVKARNGTQSMTHTELVTRLELLGSSFKNIEAMIKKLTPPSAAQKLNEMAQRYSAEHRVGFHMAYAAVARSREGAALFAEAVRDSKR